MFKMFKVHYICSWGKQVGILPLTTLLYLTPPVQTLPSMHTCDISRFRRELPIWSLSSRSHSREAKPPDERFFQCHFSRTVFLSEDFIVYGNIYLANKLFTAQKCLTFISLIDDHWCVSDNIDAIKITPCGQF